MSVLKQTPFVKLLIPFTAGIISMVHWPACGTYLNIYLIFFLSLFLFSFLFQPTIANNRLSIIIGFMVFYGLGAYITFLKIPTPKNSNLNKVGLEGKYLIKINDIPQIRIKTTKVEALVLQKIERSGRLFKVEEKVMVYLSKDIQIPHPGELMLVRCQFITIPAPENPYQFNYKKFLKWQGITYQTYINSSEKAIHTSYNTSNLLQKLSYNGVLFLKGFFKKNIKDSVALGVTESLIFGYKDDIPQHLIDSYSKTGTLHVLAVSGLHVAFVFILLARLLWFIEKIKNGKWIKTIIVIGCIWFYCMLTGMSPSIIRAGLMITLVLISKSFNRDSNVLNTVFVTAFLILCINPLWILNVGFQLSFAAVLGIVLMQKSISNLWKPENRITKEVWNIIVITICAQIATFPITIFYFNQFPNYFLVSNLVIIPITSLIIFTGFGMVLFCKIPVLLIAFSRVTETLVKFTNYFVTTIEGLPYSFSDGLKINLSQVILIYIGVICFFNWMIKMDKKYFLYTLLSLFILVLINLNDQLHLLNQKSIVYFKIENYNAILISKGSKSILLTDLMDQKKLMFSIRGWLIEKRKWPVEKFINLNHIDTIKINEPKKNLYVSNGVVIFNGIILNFLENNLLVLRVKRTYILPKFFTWKTFSGDNMYADASIGLHKSKRLQKKVKIFLSDYHKNVIYDMQKNGFKLLLISD